MILHGDSLDRLKDIETDSIDAVITDPPYGYSFMGKDWDKAVPCVEIWQECLRVLKPGAFCMVMSAPRSDVQMHMISNLEQAGFRIDFTPIYWTYASGFPKAGNIGKMVDKRNGRDQETYKPFAEYLKASRVAKGYSMARMDEMLGTNTAYSWWEGRASGVQLPRKEYYLRLKEILDLDDRFDELIEREEAARQIIGTRKVPAGHAFAGEIYETANGDKDFNDTLAATPEAKALDGSYAGFQPKPAVEVIIVAMKPLSEKTFVDQALKNGKGITWLDDCRIPTSESWTPHAADDIRGGNLINSETKNHPSLIKQPHDGGRFPANLIVSDDVLNDGVDRKVGGVGAKVDSDGKKDIYAGGQHNTGYSDNGSYSRYFDLDKWANTLPFLITPKASKREKNEGLENRDDTTVGDGRPIPIDNAFQRGKTERKNSHPTVKPLKLMSYLITLTTREGDTVLDPFCGSGTTCIAAKMLKREYIGIEREAEYVEIAEARLKAHEPELTLL